MTADSTDPALMVLDRTLDAPLEDVWRQWADPDCFAGWYGPPGAEVRVADMDVREGGRRHFSMSVEQPSGTVEMWFVGEFLDVEEPFLLRYSESMSDADGHAVEGEHAAATTVTMGLEDLGGTTHLRLTHEGVPAGSPGETGWRRALDKLAASLP